MDALRLEPGGGVRALSFAIKAVEVKVARCHVFGDGVMIAFAIFFKGKHTLIRRSKMDFNLVGDETEAEGKRVPKKGRKTRSSTATAKSTRQRKRSSTAKKGKGRRR